MEKGKALYGMCHYQTLGVEQASGTSWPGPLGPAWTAEVPQMNMVYCTSYICHSLVSFHHTRKEDVS